MPRKPFTGTNGPPDWTMPTPVTRLRHIASALGQGTARHDGNAFEWLQKAAANDHIAATAALAVLHHLGRGTEKDEATAYRLTRKAAAQDQPARPLPNLAVSCRHGFGTPVDGTRADRLSGKAPKGAAGRPCWRLPPCMKHILQRPVPPKKRPSGAGKRPRPRPDRHPNPSCSIRKRTWTGCRQADCINTTG